MLSALWQWFIGGLIALLTILAGCGPMTWKVNDATAQGHASTQFEIGYYSKGAIVIGFPGELQANAQGEMQGSAEPKPSVVVTTTVPAATTTTETVTP